MPAPDAGRLPTGDRNPQVRHLLLTDTGTVQAGSTGLRDFDEDPLPFPMGIGSVMVPVLVLVLSFVSFLLYICTLICH